MAGRAVGVMRTLNGQVARARPCRTLEGLLELVLLLGRENVLERPHKKGGVVLCSIDCEDTSDHLLDSLL